MTGKILVIIDMQNDFLTGVLGNEQCAATVEKVVTVVENSDYDGVVLTRDTHFDNYMDTQEGKKLPVPHCIKDTEGWQVNDDVVAAVNTKFASDVIYYLDKPSFGCLDIKKMIENFGEENVDEIHFVGVCTGICVISNVLILKASFPEKKVCVIEQACACVTPDTHKTAIEAMKTCQVDVI